MTSVTQNLLLLYLCNVEQLIQQNLLQRTHVPGRPCSHTSTFQRTFFMNEMKQARLPQSQASSKLWHSDWLTDWHGSEMRSYYNTLKIQNNLVHIHEIQFLWLKILSAPAWTWHRQVIGGTGFLLEQFSAFFFKCNQPWACTLLFSTLICFALLYPALPCLLCFALLIFNT